MKHRLITRGPPVRVDLRRFTRPSTEWVGKAIQEDVGRGQLVKRSSLSGSPAFPTRAAPDHQAIKRERRLVVDYRDLSRVTENIFFTIPNADGI